MSKARLATGLAFGLILGLMVIGRDSGAVDWLNGRPVFAAIPLLAIGGVALGFALGPERWLQREAERHEGKPRVYPHRFGKRVASLSITGMRTVPPPSPSSSSCW